MTRIRPVRFGIGPRSLSDLGCPTRQLLHALLYLLHPCSRADADMLAVTVRTPYGRFDVVSTTPASTSGPCTPSQRHLDALVTKAGEKCGLENKANRGGIWIPACAGMTVFFLELVAAQRGEMLAMTSFSQVLEKIKECIRGEDTNRGAVAILSTLNQRFRWGYWQPIRLPDASGMHTSVARKSPRLINRLKDYDGC